MARRSYFAAFSLMKVRALPMSSLAQLIPAEMSGDVSLGEYGRGRWSAKRL